MDEWMDKWMNRWVDEWLDKWMDGQMDGQMDGWMDGWIVYVNIHVTSIDGVHSNTLVSVAAVYISILL